jgi:hydrogenase/urease accessory protein HupE
MLMVRRTGLLRAVLLGIVLSSRMVGAHEIGTTHVVVTFPTPDTYLVEITADASAILARLESAVGRPRSGQLTADEYQQGIEALRQAFLSRAHITFDGKASQPQFQYVQEPIAGSPEGALTPPGAIVKLSGAIPPHAQTFAWEYDLTIASYALTVKSISAGSDRTVWLEGSQASQAMTLADHVLPPSRGQIAAAYFALGFTHILPKGLDHILFVLGIFLFSRRLKPMLWQVSAFTVAHSITLGLTLYGLVSLSPSIVEPLIALSIVYVAVENIVTAELKPWRVALVFAFGLLHGMGFAGVLRELGLPRSEFLTGLVTFNAGVEAGQLTIIAIASLAVFQWTANRALYRRLVVVPGSLLIALTGLYWTIERLQVW